MMAMADGAVRLGILKAVGSTPLVEVDFGFRAKVFAKLECLNPGGSMKDRSALFMVEEAERKGLLSPGGTIVECSSGNQGASLAMIGAVKGYKVIIVCSRKISAEKLDAMRAYGAETVMCPDTRLVTDRRNSHSVANSLSRKISGSFMPNQYYSLSNPEAHYLTLGPEIWAQTGGKITHFFAAAGTGGTVSGAGKYLKEKNPRIKVIAVDAATSFRATKGRPKPYRLEGIGLDFDTPCFDAGVVDETLCVTDRQAIGMMRSLASRHGLLCGTSSGAVAYAVNKHAEKMGQNDLAVMVMGDSGRAYLSKGYFR
ncbi:MAG: cysteine synthase family protein [Candidatus Diapherotrites archaeon]|uniref:Cysteine synthase family protein n=1 Tax=Candidatus Iainarchaeum sp. TaxID=3101447 RepID=A0A8T3YMP6_9ARCH|nr:cysteine synthase family protein [Candidatus Diapherotrites archaeon]